jgi:hypothetical protein
LLLADHLLMRRVVVELDERSGAYAPPQRVLSRLQADLERVAVGRSPARLPSGAAHDPLEHLSDALDAFLRGRQLLFHDHLALVRAEALRRLARQDELIRAQPNSDDLDKVISPIAYGASLAASKPSSPLLDLVQTMRLVDAVLLLESAGTAYHPMRYDLAARRNIRVFTASEAILDGIWLRLPCPVVVGRRAEFEAVAKRLGPQGGPLLSCPVPEASSGDFTLMERIARSPRLLGGQPRPVPPPAQRFDAAPPSPPWSAETAIRFMADIPDGAETPLRMATLEGGTAKLDLALFLHAFRDPNPARDEEIRSLLAGLDRISLSRATPEMVRFAGTPQGYDGSDASLVPSLRLAAFTGTAEVVSGAYRYPYVIPCAVLQRHPGLMAAQAYAAPVTEADGKVDYPVPVSGCLAGRGRVDGFPEAEFAAFVNATAAADGGGNTNHSKLPRYPVQVMDLERMGWILFDPRRLLGLPDPGQDMPYQTWGYASLTNHAIALELGRLYEASRASLTRYFQTKGLNEAEAGMAAKRGLFFSAYGSRCGDARPPTSLRKLLVDKAPLGEFLSLKPLSAEDLKPFADCAVFAPFDPLLHVAVGHPAVLPFLWEAAGAVSAENDREGLRGLRQVDSRNHFGKTALMAAAQANALDSVRFLLDHGAKVNSDTWQMARYRTLAHDSRTALIYAAANGSLPLIKALLDAGADRFQADSKGRRAVDYLLGTGPGGGNTLLSGPERTEAAALLY